MAILRFLFIIIFITTLLILTIELRSQTSRIFYKYRLEVVKQAKLKQSLYQHQIQLENLTSSPSLSKYLVKHFDGSSNEN
jgi:hypothetical protein